MVIVADDIGNVGLKEANRMDAGMIRSNSSRLLRCPSRS